MAKTPAAKSAQPWSFPVPVEDVPETGAHFDISAPDDVLDEVARLADVRSLSKLEATFDIEKHGDGVRVTGRVRALAGQTCVVTLEPMESEIDEAIDVVFSPSADAASQDAEVTPGDDPPEPLINGSVDLGALATEFLLLGIDPYPRKKDATFTPAVAGPPVDPSEHPFAALAALKKSPKH